MKKMRIAQVGFGEHTHAPQIFGSLLKQKDIFEVVGYVLPEGEGERFRENEEKYTDLPRLTLEQVLEDPTIEAVTVETDEIHLTKYATMALKAGKHVHMEKPGGIDPEAFEKLIALAKESDKTLHFGYMYRYNPYVIDLLERADRGEFGKIISVEAHMSCWHRPALRQWLEAFPGGMMFYLGCHLVDLIYRLQGQPKKVLPFNTCSGLDGVTAQDCALALFEYENAYSIAKTYAVEKGGFSRRQLVVTGEKMTVELNPLEWYVPGTQDLQTTRVISTESKWTLPREEEKCEPLDRYDGMLQGFVQIARGERENPYTLDYELELYKLLQQACGN